jgi:formylglycine-generating enzyme required for sulfatase activity
MTRTLASLALAFSIASNQADAQAVFGTGCAGASGVTPTLAVSGVVKSGQNWTLEVTAPGGIGLGYLAIGFSNTSASAFGGLPLPLDLGGFFGDPLWNGCSLNVDTTYALQPYTFDPNLNGGVATFTFPGWSFGTVYIQAINIDADFVTRIAGVSRGVEVRSLPNGMVAIAPGTFSMGSDAASGAPYFDGQLDNVVHTVTLSYPFWMSEHEVTQARYELLMGFNPSISGTPNHPVDHVSWSDARLYCALLTFVETIAGNVPVGYEYRLPTEAEWEYACRAGTTTEFNVGDGLLCSDARFSSTYHPTQTHCGQTGTVEVGSYAPNAWGLHDMHGNVSEWCLDSYHSYDAAPVTDPFVSLGSLRAIRGGGRQDPSYRCRSAYRAANGPNVMGISYGFRVVLGPVLVP